MAYLTFANFRAETLAEPCAQLALTEGDATDADITSAITRLSQRIDDWCDDHFESENLVLSLSGDDTPTLWLPKRCTSVTQVRIQNAAGIFTVNAATVYRLVSSLESTGSRRKRETDIDYLEVLPYQYLSGATWGPARGWPCEANSVEVTGAFGWTTCPTDIKRALALLVYDNFKPLRQDLRRVDRWQTADASFNMALTEPTGIPEADALLKEYKREGYMAVG